MVKEAVRKHCNESGSYFRRTAFIGPPRSLRFVLISGIKSASSLEGIARVEPKE